MRLLQQSIRLLSTTAVSQGNVIQELEKRGLVAALTSRSAKSHVASPRTIYLGLDPSAKSLHVGNLVTLIALLHFQLHGHDTIALIGGATGSVGDPSGRSTERNALPPEVLEANIQTITSQVTRFFQHSLRFAATRSATSIPTFGRLKILNNLDWFKDVSLLQFLSTVGKRARVSSMLARDAVRSRLDSAAGISFTEFTYNLLQAYDFLHLHKHENCTLQLGGSDQYGNIMAGVEMIHRGSDADNLPPVFGVTLPLLTTSTGEKFGKSAGNAVWLDASLTSPYELYQFFLRTQDSDLLKYLRIFTFLPLDRIEQLVTQHEGDPGRRLGQTALAEEVLMLIHGENGLQQAKLATQVFFNFDSVDKVTSPEALEEALGPSYTIRLLRDEVVGRPILEIAMKAKLVESQSKARQLVSTKALQINQVKVVDGAQTVRESDIQFGRLLLLRAGKTLQKLIVLDG